MHSSYHNRWQNFAILWAFIFFNVTAAIFLYWLARTPKRSRVKKQVEAANETHKKQDQDYGSKSQITDLQCHDS
jgi:CDR ABC transporter